MNAQIILHKYKGNLDLFCRECIDLRCFLDAATILQSFAIFWNLVLE